MGPSELLEHVVAVFERLGIPCLVTGSVAAMAYGEPRLTTGILLTTGAEVDRPYIGQWAQQLGLTEIWEAIEKKLRS